MFCKHSGAPQTKTGAVARLQLKTLDRIEPAAGSLEDFLFPLPGVPNIGVEHPSCQLLVYRKLGRWGRTLNWITRLLEVHGVQLGVPGLTWKHFLHDWMHTVDLGVSQYLIAASVRALLDLGYFGTYSETIEPDRLDKSMMDSLSRHYIENSVPRKNQVAFNLASLGPQNAPQLTCKAGPTRMLVN